VTDKEMIFQIGCGYTSDNKWIYKSFHVSELTDKEEERILNEWLSYMESLKTKLRFRSLPKIYHWSHSEKSNFKKVSEKYNLKQQLNWVDLLKVFRQEPIVVKDSLNYNLKNIARALQSNGLIKTIWDGTYADGMGVMVSIIQDDNIRSLEDCKVLCEILSYLRINHT
jgi:signal recognition particle subunit SEC65